MYKPDEFEINASVVEVWGDMVCRCINTIELFCFVCLFSSLAWNVCLSGGVQPVSYCNWRMDRPGREVIKVRNAHLWVQQATVVFFGPCLYSRIPLLSRICNYK